MPERRARRHRAARERVQRVGRRHPQLQLHGLVDDDVRQRLERRLVVQPESASGSAAGAADTRSSRSPVRSSRTSSSHASGRCSPRSQTKPLMAAWRLRSPSSSRWMSTGRGCARRRAGSAAARASRWRCSPPRAAAPPGARPSRPRARPGPMLHLLGSLRADTRDGRGRVLALGRIALGARMRPMSTPTASRASPP